MTTKSLVVAAIGAATVVAAGAGSFMASRTRPEASTSTQPAVAPNPPAVMGTSVAVEPPAPPVEASAARIDEPTERKAGAREARSRTDAPAVSRPAETPNRPAAAAPARVDPVVSAPPPAPATPPATAVTPPAQAAPEIPPPPPPAIETPAPAPPKPRFEEITVKDDAVIGIRFENAVSSETAKVEDRVTARVSRDVTVDGRTAIPAGALLEGTVTAVERGGKFKERSRIGIRFTTLVLGENSRQPIQTETIFRDGESPTTGAASKVGASAVVGAILGAVIGGKKGAVIGSTAGAAGGTAAVAAGGRNEVTIAAGAPLTVRLTAPLTVQVERDLER